jgi:cysteine desulfuration protein SufE
MNIEDRKNKILAELAGIVENDERYKFIINKGRDLAPLTESEREEKFLIPGCLSRAWLVPSLENGQVRFKADSDAAIVKGIIAILVYVYSGSTPSEILALSPDFLKEGGISEHLSMNRRSGLASAVKQMMLYATAYRYAAANTRS